MHGAERNGWRSGTSPRPAGTPLPDAERGTSAPGQPFERRLAELEARVLSLADKQAGIIDDLLLLMRHVEARLAAIERNTALLDTVDSIQRAQADLEQRLAAAGPQGAQLSRAKVAGAEFYENGNDQKGTG